MVENGRQNHHESNPHFDGENEGPISDPLGGPTMGVRSDNGLRKNPYGNVKLKAGKKMNAFQKYIK